MSRIVSAKCTDVERFLEIAVVCLEKRPVVKTSKRLQAWFRTVHPKCLRPQSLGSQQARTAMVFDDESDVARIYDIPGTF